MRPFFSVGESNRPSIARIALQQKISCESCNSYNYGGRRRAPGDLVRPIPPRRTICLSSYVFWWLWTLCRDARDAVDVKDGCASPNQSCFDDFEFVDRVGFNRGGDAVFALYFLVHLPCPPSLTLNRNRVEMVWRADEGLDPSPGVLRHSFADELPQARISYVGGRPTERLNLVGPPKPAGVAGKPASSGDGVRHRGRIMAENGGSRRAPTT